MQTELISKITNQKKDQALCFLQQIKLSSCYSLDIRRGKLRISGFQGKFFLQTQRLGNVQTNNLGKIGLLVHFHKLYVQSKGYHETPKYLNCPLYIGYISSYQRPFISANAHPYKFRVGSFILLFAIPDTIINICITPPIYLYLSF